MKASENPARTVRRFALLAIDLALMIWGGIQESLLFTLRSVGVLFVRENFSQVVFLESEAS